MLPPPPWSLLGVIAVHLLPCAAACYLIYLQWTKRSRNSDMAMVAVSSKQLSSLLASERVLLLDCRSFLLYNHSHVKLAHNVHAPAILRRRSQGLLSLRNIITDPVCREKFSSSYFSFVALYDDRGTDFDALADDSVIKLVIKNLKKENSQVTFCFLNGGFCDYLSCYPQSCTTTCLQQHVHPSSTLPTTSAETPTFTRTQSLLCPRSKPFCCSLSSSSSEPNLAATPSCQCPADLAAPPLYDQGEPVEILPHLYLGSAHHAAQRTALDRIGVTALLNVSPRTCPNFFESSGKFTYKCIPVDDTGSADIGCWFGDALAFIDQVESEGGRVLVHCQAGVSRSATICLAYLMARRQLRLDEAFEYVKSRRHVISPNFNFLGQLLAWENQILGKQASSSPKHFVFDFSPIAAFPSPSCGESLSPKFAALCDTTPLLTPTG